MASKKLEPEIQKLVFKGAVTSNEKTLKEYGLKENDFMVLLTSKVNLFQKIQFIS